MLAREGYDTAAAVIALFSMTGFTPDLFQAATSRRDVELVDLERLYGRR